MKAKISAAEQMKVHTMLVIGNRDMEKQEVSVRVHGKGTSARGRGPKLPATVSSRSRNARADAFSFLSSSPGWSVHAGRFSWRRTIHRAQDLFARSRNFLRFGTEFHREKGLMLGPQLCSLAEFFFLWQRFKAEPRLHASVFRHGASRRPDELVVIASQGTIDKLADEVESKNSNSFLARGYALADEGKFEEALTTLEEARQLNDKAAEVYQEKAYALAGLKRYDEAIAEATTAIQLEPNYGDAHQIRGNALRANSKFDLAIADLSLALLVNRRDSFALIGRGLAYYHQSQFRKALADMNALLELRPDSFEARLLRADIYQQLGEPAKAKADRALLSQTKPNNADEYLRRARTFKAEGKSDAVLADADKAMELNKDLSFQAIMLKCSVHLKKEDLPAAMAEVEKGIALEPANPMGLQVRAAIHHRAKRYAEASQDAKKSCELEPANPFYRLNYAYALSRVGDYGGAQREFEEAERSGHRSAWFYNNLAWLLSTADDDRFRGGARAETTVKRALELMPNEPKLWDTQAAVCAELGRFDEAVRWQKRYLSTKTLTAEKRKNGQKRLNFYQNRQPFRQVPGE